MVERDPFSAARAAQRRTTLRIVLAVVAALALGAAVLAGARLLRRPAAVRPGPLVAALRRTSFREPADGSGWTRLASALPAGAAVSAAAVGLDGTVAIAFSRPGDAGDRVLAWRDGSYRVAHDTATQVTALAVSPEGETWVGTMQGGIVVLRRDGSLFPSGQRTGGSSIAGFAFDARSPKTAVLVAGGEVFTASRGTRAGEVPLRPGALSAVTMPPNVRTRRVLYDSDGRLVLAGSAGAVFIATGSGWDDRTLAAVGDVAAIGLDGAGDLVAVQSTGHVWRESGASWDALGHVPHPPLAIGELPDRGLVVATDDGQLFSVTAEHDGALAPGYAATTEEPVFSAQVAGANVLFVSTHRVRVWDGATWDSADADVTQVARLRTLDDCNVRAPLRRVDPLAASFVACGTGAFHVGDDGLTPWEHPPALPDDATEDGRWERAGRVFHEDDAEDGVRVAWARGALAPVELVHLPRADGAVLALDAVDAGDSFDALLLTASYRVLALHAAPGVQPVVLADVASLSHALCAPDAPDCVAPADGELPDGDVLFLGGGPHALVILGGRGVARVDLAHPGVVEALTLPPPAPLELDFVGPTERWLATPDGALWLAPGAVVHVPEDGAPTPFVLPTPGLVPTPLWRDVGAVAVSPHGDLALLADQGQQRRILRCRERACRVVDPPPRDTETHAVGFTTGDRLWVTTGDHELAVHAR